MVDEKRHNPYIDPYNYFEVYQESLQNTYNKETEQFKYQQMTHSVFKSEEAKQWLIKTKEMVTMAMTDFTDPNAQLRLAANQGSKTVIFHIEKLISDHEKYIHATSGN